MTLVLFCILAYFVGNLNFGMVWQYVLEGPDVRKLGSKNVGASNVMRLYGKLPSLITFLGDALKGALVVVCVRFFFDTSFDIYVASFCVLLGHIYPVLLRFHGGKGVATLLGVFYAWAWPVGLLCACVWVGVFVAKRIASLASLTMCLVAPVLFLVIVDVMVGFAALSLCLVVLWAHRPNIKRLFQGREATIT